MVEKNLSTGGCLSGPHTKKKNQNDNDKVDEKARQQENIFSVDRQKTQHDDDEVGSEKHQGDGKPTSSLGSHL